VPLGAGRVLLSERSLWRFYTEPEARMAGRWMYWPCGRVLGGSSTINGMLWVRREPAEYDQWCDLGCPGWGYEDVLPFLKRCESYAQGDPARRGTEGPVNVVQFEPDELGAAFHRACQEAGIPATADYNGAQYEGVSILQTNTRRGLRHGGHEAYLDPARGQHAPGRARADNDAVSGPVVGLGGACHGRFLVVTRSGPPRRRQRRAVRRHPPRCRAADTPAGCGTRAGRRAGRSGPAS
jgi:choline dehydrogenase-like flavoprotein